MRACLMPMGAPSTFKAKASILLSFVMPGLVPGIHVDGRVKPGHDE